MITSLTARDRNVSLGNHVLASCVCALACCGSCSGQNWLVLLLQSGFVSLSYFHYWGVVGGVFCVVFGFLFCGFFFFKVNFLGTGETGEFLYTIKHAECFKGR